MEPNISNFNKNITEKPEFPKIEEEILNYWDQIDAFQTQLKKSEGLPEYTFYDGPPFATGLPHYGHITAGTIKDVVTRYWTQNGYHVERKFGWDCHGLPIECIINEKLKISTKKQLLELGIEKYNEACRDIVMTYANDWKFYTKRLGRWIDFENDYKTMDLSFMESVWWVFKQIYDKGMVYRKCKVMPYSSACNTVLSNMEASMNYKDLDDPSVYVSLPLLKDPNTRLIIWTTTPWTLPSNLAVCVNPEFNYVTIRLNGDPTKQYIIAEVLLKDTAKKLHFCTKEEKVAMDEKEKQDKEKKDKGKNKKGEDKKVDEKKSDDKKGGDKKGDKKGGDDKKVTEEHVDEAHAEEKHHKNWDIYEIVSSHKGKDLEGLEYEPLFTTYYENHVKKGAFRVICGYHVTEKTGTGLVHTAPSFGEDDYSVGLKYGIMDADRPPIPYDDDGVCTADFPLCQGIGFKDCDKIILDDLKKRGRLLLNSRAKHSYPCCYRTNTPLMQKAIPSWFIKIKNEDENDDISQFKKDMISNNLKSRWVPDFVQHKRFANWLSDAKDWCFSRNRCWGNPIPIWVSDDFEEKICVGSIKELEELSGVKGITDLHREYIDKITIPSKQGKGVLRRIEEVFDCWFESGSMPYAQVHFPFSMDKDAFFKRFPGEFIAEGVDQTRGWFYTLTVISTALFNTNPFKNLIVNGLVLDKFGNKLSKKDKNFEDPKEYFKSFGSDAIRLYLINSGLVRGQSLKFNETGLLSTVKDIFLPLYNSFRFLIQNIQRYESNQKVAFYFDFDLIKNEFSSLNITDRWIIAYNQRLISYVRKEMEEYRLYTVVSELLVFLDKLTNWYIRLNRARLKGDYGLKDCVHSLNVLFSVLLELTILLSPFIPFQTEYIYQNLRQGIKKESSRYETSIHFLRIPIADETLFDTEIEETMKNMIKVIDMGRLLRDKNKLTLKRPLKSIEIINFDEKFLKQLNKVEYYIQEELNVIEITYNKEEDKFIKISCKPNAENLFRKSKDHKELMKEENKEDDPALLKELDVINNETTALMNTVKILDSNDLKQIILNGTVNKNGLVITLDHVLLKRDFLPEFEKNKIIVALSSMDCGIRVDTSEDQNILNTYYSRDFTNQVQRFRKEIGIEINDDIIIKVEFDASKTPKFDTVYSKFLENMRKVFKVPFGTTEKTDGYNLKDKKKIKVCEDEEVEVSIFKK